MQQCTAMSMYWWLDQFRWVWCICILHKYHTSMPHAK